MFEISCVSKFLFVLIFELKANQFKMSYQRRQSHDPSALNRRRFTSDCITPLNRSEDNLSLIKYHYTEILKLIGKENPLVM